MSVTSKYQAGLAGSRLSELGVGVGVCMSERVIWRRNQDVQAKLPERLWGLMSSERTVSVSDTAGEMEDPGQMCQSRVTAGICSVSILCGGV